MCTSEIIKFSELRSNSSATKVSFAVAQSMYPTAGMLRDAFVLHVDVRTLTPRSKKKNENKIETRANEPKHERYRIS